MPSPERIFRKQNAVLWPATGRANRYGQPEIDEPRQIKVRWVAVKRLSRNARGEEVLIVAEAVVGEDIATGSQMWLGCLDDFYGVGSAGDDTEIMEVVSFTKVPDVKGRLIQRSVSLARLKDNQGPE